VLDPRRGIFRQNVRAGFALGTGTPPVHVHGLVGERGGGGGGSIRGEK
jgi:hypothetical protein